MRDDAKGKERRDRVIDKMKREMDDRGGAPPPTIETAQEINETIVRALRRNEETNEIGYSALDNLGQQRETIQRSLSNVTETQDNLRQSRRALRDMRMQLWKERAVKGLVIASLVAVIMVIVYVKWGRRK